LNGICAPWRKGWPTPRAIIFDLENCLASAGEIGLEVCAPAFAAIRNANRSTLSDERLNAAFADCFWHSLDSVAAQYGFSDEMRAVGWKYFSQMEVQGALRGYADLAALSELPADLFLVTSGFRRLQTSKIKALGVEALFRAIYVDAIDESDRRGKHRLFELISDTYRLHPADVLVVGDSLESEIDAGNRLGMRTVQILRDGVQRTDHAIHHITSLAELKHFFATPAN
jgi:putative hydrolase of the HAD superfamily